MTYQMNGNINTKCPKSEDGKHVFDVYGAGDEPQCSECGVSVDAF